MIAYYDEHGMLVDVYPRNKNQSLYENRDIAYQANVVCIYGTQYDISTPRGYKDLPVPDFIPTWDILNLAYILKIHINNISNPALIPVAVEKTLIIMRNSGMLWRKKDYLQVIRSFYRVGLFIEGDEFETSYRKMFPADFSNDDSCEEEHLKTKEYFRKKWEKKKKQT